MNRWSDAVLSMLAGIVVGAAFLVTLGWPERRPASSDATHPFVFIEPSPGVHLGPIELEHLIQPERLQPCYRPGALRLMDLQIEVTPSLPGPPAADTRVATAAARLTH